MRFTFFIRSLLIMMGMLALSAASFAQVSIGISIGIAPPELPVYEQPVCPDEGYIWTPGYWAYSDDDFYWVPGTWVLAPEPGLLWTPGYWAWVDNGYVFYDGYWGPQVGFYGGVSYGYGYFGHGYEGGRWDNGRFFYNRSVTNVNVTVIHNVYNTTVNNTTVTRVSYNGGNGGIQQRPRPEEEAAAHQKHVPPVPAQTQHVQAARTNPELRAAANHGKPPVAATPKPGAFKDRAVVPAKEAGAVHTSAAPARSENGAARPNSAASPNTAVHPNEIPAPTRPVVQPSANAELDKKDQQELDQLHAKQEQERQRIQQQHDQEHAKLPQQDQAKKQQLEQQHQQQTQQLQQKHAEEQKQLAEKQKQERQNPPKPPKGDRPPGA